VELTMKILAVCGNGLGSSFMISINVNKTMKPRLP